MSKDIVLITNQVPDSVTEPVQGLAKVIMGGKGYSLMTRGELLQAAAECTAIINQAEVRVDEELLQAASRLKIVANISIGIDNLDIAALNKAKVWATNAPGYFAQPVAEYVLAGILMLSRRLVEMDAFVRSGEWSAFEPGRWDGYGLKGRILGIIGYGQIGKLLETQAKAFGMNILTYNANDGSEALDKLLTQSDCISVHVPLLTGTRGLIGEDAFAKMKEGVILANASRGGVVHEPAMITALQKGKLAGAVLDVFAEEPKVPEVLKKMPNVLLTPHVAGGTHQSRQQARLCAFRNVAAVLRGETPPNAVNNPFEGVQNV